MDVPFELIELGGEGIGEDEVVVDEFTIGATRAIRDAPAEGLLRAGQDLTNAMAILEVDFIGMGMVAEAPGLDDGEETPADLGFFLLGKLDRDDAFRKGTVEQRPEAFANAGGVHDDVLRTPGRGEGFELAKDGQVVFADPTVAFEDMVGGTPEGLEGGEINGDDGEGGGIAPGVAEAEVGGVEGVEAGFVHAGNVDEESAGGRGQGDQTPPPPPACLIGEELIGRGWLVIGVVG